MFDGIFPGRVSEPKIRKQKWHFLLLVWYFLLTFFLIDILSGAPAERRISKVMREMLCC